MIHSITGWKFAQSPNYKTNENLLYPYSEVPYIGNYKLVRLPLPKDKYIEHLDYWGEGRINVKEGSSGYSNCYNVNHQYQLVSNGPDRDKKIPNRVPVISYTNCDTSGYIVENSVKLVTLMGAPINASCAADIARMVNAEVGKVVVYGFGENDPGTKNLTEALKEKGLYYCDVKNTNELLKSITLFAENEYRMYLNVTDLGEELYKHVVNGEIEKAVDVSKTLKDNGKGSKIADIVNKLLTDGKKSFIMEYAYDLWNSTYYRDVVTNYFPLSFKLILHKDFIKIMNKNNLFALKLGDNIDSKEQRLVLGEGNDKSSEKVRWEMIPISENNHVYFRIMDMEDGTLLILDDDNGVKKAKATRVDDSKTHWSLEPVKIGDDILFFITNKDCNQGLKLGENTDEHGNKEVLGHDGSVREHPELYGWYVAPW